MATQWASTSAAARLRTAWNALGEGRELPADLRDLLERRLGADLTALRVHTGPTADAAARAFGADAITCGSAVFFRDGAYRPDEPRGLRLLAHEVAHVGQQAQGRGPRSTAHGMARSVVHSEALAVGRPDDAWEAEADRFADAVLADRGAAGASEAAGAKRRRIDVRPGPSDAVQCHDSFEHRILGDGKTQDLVAISANGPSRKQVLERQIALMSLWRTDPHSVTQRTVAERFPEIHTLLLGPDQVVVTYGDLNALPDYLANPLEIDKTPLTILLPILQVIRQQSFNKFTEMLTGHDPNVTFADAACAPWRSGLINSIVETAALDRLTMGLGPAGQDHYQGLLARNACHFAPYSWHRWSVSHLIARNLAEQAYRATSPQKELLTQRAWKYHGYADHFLQDSFAAGHLTNKTLVMQWFTEWAENEKLLPFADWQSVKYMTAALQPGLAGRQLYDPEYAGPSIDPQTVQESADLAGRILGGGLGPGREDGRLGGYQDYLTFLTSAVAQFGAASLHDYYNGNSVTAASKHTPQPYELWGDNTLLTGRNGTRGVQETSETAQTSQRALREILAGGGTGISMRSIQDRFPTQVADRSGKMLDLETWATTQKGWCEENVFAPVKQRIIELLLRMASPRLGTVSRDQPLAERWYCGLGGKATYDEVAVLAVGGRTFASADGYVYELSPETGLQKQKIELKGVGGNISTSLAADANRLYVGVEGRVHALPLASAWPTRPEWTSKVLSGLTHDHPVHMLLRNGRLYAGSNGYVHELRPADGASLQEILVTDRIGDGGDYTTRLTANATMLYVGTHGYLYALRFDNWGSRPLWSRKLTENPLSHKPVTMLATADRLYAASAGYVCELHPSSGTIEQRIEVSSEAGSGDYTTDLVTDGGLLYAGTHGYIYALPVGTPWGKDPKWTSPKLGGLLWHRVALVYLNDQLFAACNGFVYELDLLHGSETQSAEVANELGAGDYTSALTTDGTTLYLGTHGYAYRLLITDLQPTPKGCWRLAQTSGTAAPDERGHFPAVAANVTWQPMAAVGGCAAMTGNGQVATAGPVLNTGPGQSFTVAAWVRLDQIPQQAGSTAVFVSQDANVADAFSLEYRQDSRSWAFSRPAADINNAVTDSARASAPVVAGVWTHLTGVYDAASGQLRIHVNGTLSGTMNVDPKRAFVSGRSLVMGRGKYNGAPIGWLNGAVRDVKVYAEALATVQISPLATAFWRLADESGSTAVDTRGAHPGKATNVEWKMETGIGGYGTFNGRDSSVATTGPVLYTGLGGSFTVAAWVRPSSLPATAATVISQDATMFTSGFSLRYLSTDSSGWAFTRYLTDRPNPASVTASSRVPATNKVWTHITGVYNAATSLLEIYVNGALKGTAVSDRTQALSAGSGLAIGRAKADTLPAEWFAGDIRDARAFGLALSPEQIKALLTDQGPTA